MNNTLRLLFFMLFVRPIVLVVIGLNLRRLELLPKEGPALVVANHNSHLDALVLISLFPLRLLRRVRPVAAAEFYNAGGWKQWFAYAIIGIIPLNREPRKRDDLPETERRQSPIAPITEALERGDIVILFPEGTRGEPEQAERNKPGIAHVAKRNPDAPITPVFMHGLGKALPRGEALLVPFFCDIYIGESFSWGGDRDAFMQELNDRMAELASEMHRPALLD